LTKIYSIPKLSWHPLFLVPTTNLYEKATALYQLKLQNDMKLWYMQTIAYWLDTAIFVFHQ